MDLKEFSGENVEAAKAKAEEYFGLSRDELKIKVVADARQAAGARPPNAPVPKRGHRAPAGFSPGNLLQAPSQR
jgi:hypothetical protein